MNNVDFSIKRVNKKSKGIPCNFPYYCLPACLLSKIHLIVLNQSFLQSMSIEFIDKYNQIMHLLFPVD